MLIQNIFDQGDPEPTKQNFYTRFDPNPYPELKGKTLKFLDSEAWMKKNILSWME